MKHWSYVYTLLCECVSEILSLQIKRPTGDILQNVTGYNMSDYLVKTYSQILRKRCFTKQNTIQFISIHRLSLDMFY